MDRRAGGERGRLASDGLLKRRIDADREANILVCFRRSSYLAHDERPDDANPLVGRLAEREKTGIVSPSRD